jgi:spermidine/putrescine ABC transporter ATP-binding subunit
MSVSVFQPEPVRLEEVSVRYRDTVAVDRLDFNLPAGEILALLGPSGCGKSTLLRSIAGFVPHSGNIYIGERCVTQVPSHRRNIGMVFQDYALFPHMTVAENIGFGLKMRGVARPEMETRISEALTLVDLEGFGHRMARQLSGGQQQRVALARSLVIRPAVLLLDEPLSALDKKLREEMRLELKRIQRLTGVTTIFVTHDQDEALGLADRLALMSNGSFLQVGKPEEIYRNPVDPFVARFVGITNSAMARCIQRDPEVMRLEIHGGGVVMAAASAQAVSTGDDVTIFVRPEQIALSIASSREAETVTAVLLSKTYLGRCVECCLRLDNGTNWIANVADNVEVERLQIDTRVSIRVEPRDVLVYRQLSAGYP